MNPFTVSIKHREAETGAIYLLFSLLALPRLLFALGGVTGLSDAVLNFIFFLLNFLAVLGIFRRYLTLSAVDALKKPRRILVVSFLFFIFYFVSNLLVNYCILSLFPDFSNRNDSNIQQMAGQNGFLMILGTVFFVPLTEECLYRGLVFGLLRQRSRLYAYLISVPVFCMIHIMGYIGAASAEVLFLSFLQYIPAGIFLALAYERADNIFAPILIHTAVNALGMALSR